jgi:diacylglycerol O-acyltransferase / wax synthase
VTNKDRLTGLDSSFLHLEGDSAHMHVAGCMVIDGSPPGYDELVEHIVSRLYLIPRYRQRLAFVPLGQGRPVWVDDPHFNPRYHVRHTALPKPGGDTELRRLAGRVFSQALDRARPLWEMWLVEGLEQGRFALLSKTHHATIDGISGVDIATVLFDVMPRPQPIADPEPEWAARPLPSRAQLLADALLERATVPGELVGGVRATVRGPEQVARRITRTLAGVGSLAWSGLQSAPSSPFNVRIGPHRRFTWVDTELDRFKGIKNSLGGTVNDVVLTVVADAMGRYMRLHGDDTEGLELKAMIPISVRADVERGALGNRIAAIWAPLPVDAMDPVQRLLRISYAMDGLKESGQAVGAGVLTRLTGFAPPTIVAQAARLQARQRLFNVVITNVPGPQFPLYILGRELHAIYPMVPLAENTALGIAIMSYKGRMGFGLVSDYDALADLEALADELRVAIAELSEAAGADPGLAAKTDRSSMVGSPE